MLEESNLTGTDTQSAYAPDGVDLTLIRWMLSLTPDERLDLLQGFIDDLWELRGEDAETWFTGNPSNAD